MPIVGPQPSKAMAENLFKRKASPDANLTPKAFLSKKFSGVKKGLVRAKDAVIDKVSDAISFPARRNAQKSMLKADQDLADVKMVRATRGTQPVPNDYRSPLFRARANVAVLKAQKDAVK